VLFLDLLRGTSWFHWDRFQGGERGGGGGGIGESSEHSRLSPPPPPRCPSVYPPSFFLTAHDLSVSPTHPSTFMSIYPPYPHPPTPPLHFLPAPHLAPRLFFFFCFFWVHVHSHQPFPFVIISQLMFPSVSIPNVGSSALHRPLQTCNAPPPPHIPHLPSLLPPSLLLSAAHERRQLEETERNGPNYSIGN